MHIADRKTELIRRDPLGREFDSLFAQWMLRRKHDATWERLTELRKEINKKYCCTIYIPEITIQGVANFWFIAANPRISVEDAREGGTITICPETEAIRTYSFEKDGSIYCPPHKIPIIIEPTTLTLNDERRIKQEVWNIVKKYIPKATKENGTWDPVAPEGEPRELAWVLRLRSDTFQKYLNWYDLKMAGLPFRLIAFVDLKSGQDRKEKVFQRLIDSNRRIHVGERVPGESNVRYGFNVIYEAIHRRKAPSKDGSIETVEPYNCPKHGTECGSDCLYLKEWFKRFESSMRP